MKAKISIYNYWKHRDWSSKDFGLTFVLASVIVFSLALRIVQNDKHGKENDGFNYLTLAIMNFAACLEFKFK